jgi:hypothetical protein
MEQPSIFLWGIEIQEPVTSLTDILVGVACVYAYILHTRQGRKEKAFRYFRWFFITTGVATILAGILGHALFYASGIWLKAPGWIISMLGVMFIERGSIAHASPLLNPKLEKFFKAINVVELLTFMTLTFYFMDFRFVQLHTFYGLVVVVFAFEAYILYKTSQKPIRWLLASILSMVCCAVVYIAEWSIHPFFNHADLAHVFMLISVILAYKGISRLSIVSESNS